MRDPYSEPVETTRGTTKSPRDEHDKDVEATNAGVSEAFQRHLEEMDITEKERLRKKSRAFRRNINTALSNFNVDINSTNVINRAMELGQSIDRSMHERLLKACMLMRQGKVEQCNKAAVVACYQIQNDIILATRLPLFFIGSWCSSQVTKGAACPTSDAVESAKKDCSNIGYSLGLVDGFGAQFAVARESLREFAQSFELGVKLKNVKEAAKQVWALRSGTKEAIERLSYVTLDATRAAYAIAFFLSTLTKLFFLFLLIKTQAYITKYLTNMDFDNIYVEGAFERIDERRKKEGRMYLLPLKKFEKQAVYWRRLGYTGNELLRSVASVLKSTILGIGLTFLFIADGYMRDMLQVLDVVTQGDIALGGGAKGSDLSGGIKIRGGDGFAAALVEGIVDGFLGLANIDLNYKLSECAPNVIEPAPELKVRFALLWSLLFFIGAFSGYLLRFRHLVTGFFYPLANRRRQMHLYNVMLANRARELDTNKNLLIQRVREDQLQQEVQELSRPTKISQLATTFANRMKKAKARCVICHDIQKVGVNIYVCPMDGCAICRQCQQQITDDPQFCVACLDRNEESIDDTLIKLEEMYAEKMAREGEKEARI